MKLKDIPKLSRIYNEASDGSEYIIFHKLDGMYSYCVTEKGAVTHLSRFTPLTEFEDGFKIVSNVKDDE